jgi:chemotaxis protein histidine kinase CheA
MELIDDPEMREVVDEFCEESLGLLKQLEEILEEMEDDGPTSKNLEQFGQIIDRIMGAANSLGAFDVGTFCEMGKIIGYKSSQVQGNIKLLEVVVAILFDAVDLLALMINKIKVGESPTLQSISTDKFIERLKWLSEKFKDIQRASLNFDKGDSEDTNIKMDNDDIECLLAKLL